MFDNENGVENLGENSGPDDFFEDSGCGAVAHRLERLGEAKRWAVQVGVPWYYSFDPDTAWKVQRCGTSLGFKEYMTSEGIVSELSHGNFCRIVKLCPCCSIRRSAKMLKVLSGKLAKLFCEDTNRYAYHVVLTVRDGPDVIERVGHLRQGLQVLRQRRKDFKKGKSSTVFGIPEGWHANTEIVRGDNSGLWHPHFHMLWVTQGPIDVFEVHDRLSTEWNGITGDSSICFLGEFGFSEGRTWREVAKGMEDWREMQDVLAVDLPEYVKYVCKYNRETHPRDCWEIFVGTHRMRLMETGGCLRFSREENDIIERLTDEHRVELDTLPYKYMMVSWNDGYQVDREELFGSILEGHEVSAQMERQEHDEMLFELALKMSAS